MKASNADSVCSLTLDAPENDGYKDKDERKLLALQPDMVTVW
jgi:hypothetical protein